jgi:hypothetical protein
VSNGFQMRFLQFPMGRGIAWFLRIVRANFPLQLP